MTLYEALTVAESEWAEILTEGGSDEGRLCFLGMELMTCLLNLTLVSVLGGTFLETSAREPTCAVLFKRPRDVVKAGQLDEYHQALTALNAETDRYLA